MPHTNTVPGAQSAKGQGAGNKKGRWGEKNERPRAKNEPIAHAKSTGGYLGTHPPPLSLSPPPQPVFFLIAFPDVPQGLRKRSSRTPRSPVVQIEPVGGPPHRSADKTPAPPPAVRKTNLQVASSTGAANARNKPVVQVLIAVKRVRNFRSCISDVGQNEHASEPEYAPRNDQRRA
jgi:hypothetical protein